MMQYLPGFRGRLAAAVGLAVLAGGSGIALMGISAWLLSRAAEHPPVLHLMVAVVLVRALGLSRGVFRYLERLVGHDVAFRLLAELRVRAYEHLAQTTLLGRRRGDLLARMTADVEAIVDLVVRVLVPLASVTILTVATTTVLTGLAPAAGALVLVSAILAGLLVPWLTSRLSRHHDASLAPVRGELAGLLTEATGSATDLLAYGADDVMLRRVQEVDGRLRRAEQRTAAAQGLATAAQVLASAIAVLGSLAVGAQAVEEGRLAPVMLAVLVLTPVALHETLATLPAVAQAWTRSRSALARVTEMITAPTIGAGDRTRPERPGSRPDPVEGPPERGHLSTTDLAIGWPGGAVLAEHIDLDLTPGDRVAVVGSSGSGKTTLAATLLGMITPADGAVEVHGRVGYLAQDAHLFDTTVAENVRIGNRDATDEDVRNALLAVGLRLPLDRTVGEHGSAVSGGEARRIALARLLVDDHDVVILDEPTEHLDAPTATALMDDVWRLLRGSAVLVITHDPAVRDRCDRVLDLNSIVLARTC